MLCRHTGYTLRRVFCSTLRKGIFNVLQQEYVWAGVLPMFPWTPAAAAACGEVGLFATRLQHPPCFVQHGLSSQFLYRPVQAAAPSLEPSDVEALVPALHAVGRFDRELFGQFADIVKVRGMLQGHAHRSGSMQHHALWPGPSCTCTLRGCGIPCGPCCYF
jgi:hypothetical protein